jgi:D-alanine-D-alanine ligase
MARSFLKEFYDTMERKRHKVDAVFAFVYNDYSTYTDDPHIEECFDAEEVKEILDSVEDLFQHVLHFASEFDFICWCSSNIAPRKHVYVYTMAQYITGCGRRTLIPALCQLYGFININADAYMSAIGCNKETMFKLLNASEINGLLTPTLFFDAFSEDNYSAIYQYLGKSVVLKPINESCCIDVSVLRDFLETDLQETASRLLEKYGSFLIQKYITGKEIGVTVVCVNKQPYALTPMELLFAKGKEFLIHKDSFYSNYKLQEYPLPRNIVDACEKMNRILSFYCTVRYDFRYDGQNYYLIDISPNPTINGFASSNYAARSSLGCDHRGILRLMVYEKFKLFEPSFN